jgi:hypothetical protein
MVRYAIWSRVLWVHTGQSQRLANFRAQTPPIFLPSEEPVLSGTVTLPPKPHQTPIPHEDEAFKSKSMLHAISSPNPHLLIYEANRDELTVQM